MGFIDGSVISIAVPQIRSGLGASFEQVQWVQNAYILFLSALMLLGGAAGDRYGLRRLFGLGIALFVLASLLCAGAWSPQSLIAFRALQGIGAAIMIPGSMAIISKNYPRDERGRAIGIWVAASSITTAFGPFLGSLLLTFGGDAAWRMIFAINLPAGAIALYLLRRHVPDDLPQNLRKLDIPGAILATLSLATIAMGLTSLGGADSAGQPIGLLVSGLVLGGCAVWWQKRAAEPMINLDLFRSRIFSGANVLTFLVWSGLTAHLFFLPMLLVVAWQLPETYAAGLFAPLALMVALVSPLSGRLVDRFGTRLLLTTGPLIVTVADLAIGYGIFNRDYWTGLLPAVLLLGLGMGLCASPLSTAVMLSVKDDQAGSASGINNMVARMAGMFAIAGLGALAAFVYGAVVKGSDLHADIKDLMLEAGFGERLTGGLYQISTVELQVVGMNHAMIVICIVTALMALTGSFVGWFTQAGKHKEDEIQPLGKLE